MRVICDYVYECVPKKCTHTKAEWVLCVAFINRAHSGRFCLYAWAYCKLLNARCSCYYHIRYDVSAFLRCTVVVAVAVCICCVSSVRLIIVFVDFVCFATCSSSSSSLLLSFFLFYFDVLASLILFGCLFSAQLSLIFVVVAVRIPHSLANLYRDLYMRRSNCCCCCRCSFFFVRFAFFSYSVWCICNFCVCVCVPPQSSGILWIHVVCASIPFVLSWPSVYAQRRCVDDHNFRSCNKYFLYSSLRFAFVHVYTSI